MSFQGPICVDYSMMGGRKKEKGKSFDVHQAFYKHIENSTNWIVVIENVPEYEERVVRKSLVSSKWELMSVKLDPRVLGLGAARARVFYVAFRKDKLEWVAPYSLKSFVECVRSKVVMSARDYFFMKLPKSKLTESNVSCHQ